MHVRVNIPAWTWRELARGVAALAPGRRGYVDRLRTAIEPTVPGWTAVPVSSARYGLALAARHLGLQGKRVAVPAYVCPAVLTGLRAADVEPVAVDCEPGSIRFDPELLEKACATGAIAGVLASNTYGLDQDFALLSRLGLPVMEDAAYQAGCSPAGGGPPCGTRGDAGVWSFNFKALTGVGGGILLLRVARGGAPEAGRGVSRAMQEMRTFANYAVRSLTRHHLPKFLGGATAPVLGEGRAARPGLLALQERPMSELQAAVALTQWESRQRLAAMQRRHSARVAEAVARCEAFVPLAAPEGTTLVHVFPLLVRVPPTEAPRAVWEVRRLLHARGVQTDCPYPVLQGSPEELPNTHNLATRLVLVPCNASLGDQQIGRIVAALEDASRAVLALCPAAATV
jgi:dTDP-4-amino-4,6-dideoxygalactose transaminase